MDLRAAGEFWDVKDLVNMECGSGLKYPVPMIVGSNEDEMAFFNLLRPYVGGKPMTEQGIEMIDTMIEDINGDGRINEEEEASTTTSKEERCAVHEKMRSLYDCTDWEDGCAEKMMTDLIFTLGANFADAEVPE